MTELVRKQRHFVNLLEETEPKQRKILLETITRKQMRAVSQIAHNVIKSVVVLTSSEKEKLKKRRRFIHVLGNRKIGYERKRRAILSNQTSLVTLIRVVAPHLRTILR